MEGHASSPVPGLLRAATPYQTVNCTGASLSLIPRAPVCPRASLLSLWLYTILPSPPIPAPCCPPPTPSCFALSLALPVLQGTAQAPPLQEGPVFWPSLGPPGPSSLQPCPPQPPSSTGQGGSSGTPPSWVQGVKPPPTSSRSMGWGGGREVRVACTENLTPCCTPHSPYQSPAKENALMSLFSKWGMHLAFQD